MAGNEQTYLVVADPMEQPITADTAYDAVICTGDILNLAPPPGSSPTGSLLHEHFPDSAAWYAEQDVPQIRDAVQHLSASPATKTAARDRYEAFFESMAAPFYYVPGNQDFPDQLSAAAPATAAPASVLEGVYGIGGMIVDDQPAFPTTLTEDEFYTRIADDGSDILIAHDLPDGFDPGHHGYDRVFTSDHGLENVEANQRIVRLPAYYETKETFLLSL